MSGATVDQAKLVMNSFMTMFEDNLVTGQAVSWNEHAGEMDATNRLRVAEQMTPRFNVTRTENGVKDLSTDKDGAVWGSETFEVTGTFNANMAWSDFSQIRDVGDARKSRALIGAATSLAEKIDAYILGIATLASDEWTGTPGAVVSQYADITAGYTRLKEEGVGDNDLFAVLSHYDRGALGDAVVRTGSGSLTDIASDVYQRGFKQEVGGIPCEFTNSLPILTTGSRSSTAGTVAGANQNVNYAAVAISASNGLYMTQTLEVATLGNNTTISKGEVFTLPNVYAYDPRKGAPVSPARLQEFTVVETVTASATGTATLRIFPALIVPGSGTGDNPNINSAQATVTTAPVNGALITFKGAASTALAPRMIMQKEAISVDTQALALPFNGVALRKKLTRIPLSVRMWQHSDYDTGEFMVRFDCALNANIRERRRIVRINGGAAF